MRTAVLVVWWIGLIGALLPTLVIVKQAFLVVRSLRAILELAERTRTAARGIARNVRPIEGLHLEGAIGPIPGAIESVAGLVQSVAQQLERGLEEQHA